MINVGDKVVVKDLSGLIKWNDFAGVYTEYKGVPEESSGQ